MLHGFKQFMLPDVLDLAVVMEPVLDPNRRPDWVMSRNWYPQPIEDDADITKAAGFR